MARLYLVFPAPGNNPTAALAEPLKFGRLHLPSLSSASRADCSANCEMSSIFLSTRQQAPCVDGKSRIVISGLCWLAVRSQIQKDKWLGKGGADALPNFPPSLQMLGFEQRARIS